MGLDFPVKKERLFWLCLTTVLLFLTIFFHLQALGTKEKLNLSQQKANGLQMNLDEVQERNRNFASELASTKQQVSKLNTTLQHFFISNYEIALLKETGLQNPIENISQDLMNHQEFIKYKGVLGGTMNFYDKSGIHVLNKKWVLADFDDGHINGYMLLRYDVKEGGVIKWRVIDQYLE